LLIKNARLNTIDNKYEIKDIYIKDGKIVKIGTDIDSSEITSQALSSSNEIEKKLEIIDLQGNKYIIPGVIDPHVHMRDPGLTHKEDLYTGSRACAKGGITTFIDMPNTVPTTTNLKALKDKKVIASTKSIVNYGFYFGGTSTDNSEVIPIEGVAATKVFMNISTGKMLVEKAITYNEKYGKKLYLCHISNKEELDIIRKNKNNSLKQIFTEVTPHHLFLTENDLKGKNEMLLRMKPELKTDDDVKALWEALNDGTIDTIGTDHAPHLLSEKLEKVTFGIPGVENSLPLMLDAVSKGKITLSRLIELMSKNPSKIFGIKDRGEIKEGYYGDLVIVDLEKKFTLENKTTLSKCGWTPFDGYTGYGKIETTIVNGKIVYDKEQIIENTGSEIEYE